MDARRTLLPLVLAVALLAGCSSAGSSGPSPGPDAGPSTVPKARIDLDPERYVTDYSSDNGTSKGGVNYSMESDASGAPPPMPMPSPMPPPPPPTIHEDNTFVDPGEHPFVMAADQPASTFGLDVDTGSFSVGRTFLTEGTLPPPASVRTDEWVTALGSDQADPTDTALGVATTSAPSALGDTRLVRVGVAARDLAGEDRLPAHLTFVVDTSGSMDIRDRLGLVKASLGLLVLNLKDDDTIAIVEYSDDAGLVLAPTPVSEAQTIVDAIDELQPSNSTNLEAGLREGYRRAQEAFDPEGVNAVILASDGVANQGLTDSDGLAGVIQDRAEGGIHLVTVGYGMGNYNDDLMEQVADRGDGFYAYLDTYEQAERLFGSQLTSTLVVVANDAKAQVTFDPDFVAEYRLLGYENRSLNTEDFDDESVDAGEVGAGHRVTAIYEVVLGPPGADLAPDAVLGKASVRYKAAGSGETVTVTEPIVLGEATDPADAPASMRFQAATAAFAEWLSDQPSAPEVVYDDVVPEGPQQEPMPGPGIGPSAPVDLDRLAAIRAEAASAAAELGELPGASVTPQEMLELMDLAAKATPTPPSYSYGE
ncbi:MAG: von Willebrand factor type A domain-containing protein [Aquihabitans sp.]